MTHLKLALYSWHAKRTRRSNAKHRHFTSAAVTTRKATR